MKVVMVMPARRQAAAASRVWFRIFGSKPYGFL